MRQPREVDRQGRHQAVFLVGQLHDGFDQVEHFQVGPQRRHGAASLDVQHVAEYDGGCACRDLQRLKTRNGCGRAECAAGVQHIDGGLDQLADGNRIAQYLVIPGSAEVKVDLQSVKVAEQADVGVHQSVPARRVDIQVTSEQTTE